MRGSALLLGTSTLAPALVIGVAAAEPVTLKIVHFNDLDRMEESDGKGGVARLASVVEEVRAGGGPRGQSPCPGDPWRR